MKLEDQVCSLELSKRLMELGVKQESLFIWVLNKKDHPKNGWSIFANSPYVKKSLKWEDQCSAFTVAELGELLKPFKLPYICRTDFGYKWKIQEDEIYNFDYEKMGKAIDFYFSETEADARAKMLIYLIENGLIKNEK